MITNKKRGFILIESLNALLLCAFALLLLFALMRFSSHRFALQYAQTSSLADILTLDSIPCAPQTLRIDNKTYEIASCVFNNTTAPLPYTLQYIKAQAVRK
ncbi:hypothetical protein [Helicobacter himalayensis]|uniref:hypothetical protein n=1 Tax=Helicobacter himalayensis TaxID=1591088 RepID=UPI000829BFEC|nr:hypothetical protein [Helicobacter himalayensis]